MIGLKQCICGLAIVLYQCLLHSVRSHHEEIICKHVHPTHDEVIHGVYIESKHMMKKRSIDQPLRILLWYDGSVFRLEPEKLNIIKNTILPEAVSFWEQALRVRKVENVILLARKCNDTSVFIKKSRTHCIETCKEVTTCGEVRLPEEHLDACWVCNSTGQNCGIAKNSTAGRGIKGYDFVFYVSAIQTDRCNKSLTVAYAAHCQQEISLDRPIAGHANFCPKSIGVKPQELEILLSTVKHEISHALGFSVSLFGFYRDVTGKPLTKRRPDTGKPALNEKLLTYEWSDKIIRTIKREPWLVRSGNVTKYIKMIVTPRVTAEVRKHFNCSHLEGAELEDQGEEGTILTHWEKRVFENEAMTGTHTQNPVITNITLALMEDTGWYKPNYYMAEPLVWGKNFGCNFVMKSCKDWMTNKRANGESIHPFCDKVKRDPLQTECSEDRSSVALCNLVKHDDVLPELYQNFDTLNYVQKGDEIYYGSSVSLADYCPYIQEFSWRLNNVVIRGSHCQYDDNNPNNDKNFALESYGVQSKCFDHTNEMWEERSCKQTRQWQHWGSGCYVYHCRHARLHISVSNYTYTCFYSHQNISVRIMGEDGWLHTGAIVCPPCNEVCEGVFLKRNESCDDLNQRIPANYVYPGDELHCSGEKFNSIGILVTTLAIFLYKSS